MSDVSGGFRDLSIGQQHAVLHDMLGRLRDAAVSQRPWEDLAGALDGLLEAFRIHFQVEEKLLDARGYEDLAGHKAEHDEFLAKVRTLRSECDRRATELMPVMVEHLGTWFRRHERETDGRAAAYLR